MKITRNWLDKFLNLSKISNEQITVALNSLGFEVDSFKDYSKLNQKLTLANVSNATPIEGTHLNFTFVDTGEDLVSPVVCGASNVKAGQFVVLIKPGQKLSNGLEIGTREIKGKTSEGMICSLEELGLEKSALTEKEQEWIYPVYTKTDTYTLIGNTDILNRIGFEDAVWEVDLTLNRSDCLSSIQLAKELANYFNLKFKFDFLDVSGMKNHKSNLVDIKIAKEIESNLLSISQVDFNVKEITAINEEWDHNIYSRHDLWLKFCGVKTEHNFYKDLANIVTLETGQPTIFLDADKVGLLEITNEPTEKNPTNLVLKTNKTIISNIGVDITEEFLPTKNSKRILALYLAIDPIFMRKQQKSFNISTVSMQRYMKPISPLLSELAYKRTIYYLDNYKIIDSASELKFNKKPTIKENVIEVELKYLQDILGIDLTAKQVIDLFKTLDFEINQKGDLLSFKVDKYRTDVSIKSDIAEEVARLYGYNNIKEVAPVLTAHEKQKNLKFKITKNIEGILIGKGFNNVKTYSLINKEEANKFNLFGISDPIDLMSPLSNLRERYRLSLFSSLLEIASANSNRGNKNLKMYEFADIYNTKNLRQTRLGIISVGDYISESFRNASIQNNFAVNKTNIINILNQFNINESELTFEPIKSEISEIHPYLNAQILYKKELIGFMFKLSPRTEQSLKLQTTYIYEINISKVVELFDKNIQAHEISKFQKSSRVITLELNPSIKYSEIIKKAIKDIKYLTNISISDIYADESMLKNQTYALSLQFEFNDIEKQLVDLQISEQWEKIENNFKKLGIKIR